MNAYYSEYRALQQLCILILRNEQHQYGNGTRKVYDLRIPNDATNYEDFVEKMNQSEKDFKMINKFFTSLYV